MALAHRIGRPFLEFSGLAHRAAIEGFRSSYAGAAKRSMRAIELARRHGWTDDPAAGIAYVILGIVLAWRGRLDEEEGWVQRAERTVRPEAEPIAGLLVHYVRGLLELIRGRNVGALAAFQAAERRAVLLAAPHLLLRRVRGLQLPALMRLGETEHAEQALADLGEQDGKRGEIRIATAVLRLARDDPHGATTALSPLLNGTAPVTRSTWLPQAFMLEAMARNTLGDRGAAGRAVERALDLAEPDGTPSAFLIQPAPDPLERHARECTKHASLIAEILSLFPVEHGGPEGHGMTASPDARKRPGGSPPG